MQKDFDNVWCNVTCCCPHPQLEQVVGCFGGDIRMFLLGRPGTQVQKE